MNRTLKHFCLFTVLSMCVAFSLMSLYQTQAIVVARESPTITVFQKDIEPDVLVSNVEDGVVPAATLTPSTSTKATPLLSSSSSVSPSRVPSVSASSSSSPLRRPSTTPSKGSAKGYKSPSVTPSITPSPLAIFIPTSLHGTRNVNRTQDFLDTTINTPLEIRLELLFGSRILEVFVHTPSHGKIASNENNTRQLIYIPDPWYVGLDSFEVEGKKFMEDGEVIDWQETVHIRIRTGVVLNQPLLIPHDNYTFSESNIVTNNEIKKILKTFKNNSIVPQEDQWLNRRYNTCAIVGNGGSLIGSKRGAEIDAHEVVVRLNLAPFLKYQEDVGSRLDISVSNGPSFINCWRRNDTDLPGKPNYEVLAQASFRNQYSRLSTCKLHNNNIKYLPMNYQFVDLVDQILNDYQRTMVNSTSKKYRSTGMLAVVAMSMVCDHVSVYGFERGPHMESHYYSNKTDREWSGHSYLAEKAFYKDLAAGTGLFEKHLSMYDLYKSFAYIVN